MWETAIGVRVLSGAEATLIKEVMEYIHEQIRTAIDMDENYTSNVAVFDTLQPTQQLMMLLTVCKALLDVGVEPPELTAVRESTIYVLFQETKSLIDVEIESSDLFEDSQRFRSLVIAAYEQSRSETELEEDREYETIPSLTETDMEEWDMFVEALADSILSGRDFEIDDISDLPPDRAKELRSMLGINDNYFSTVAQDVPPEQIQQIHEQLQQLYAM